MTEARRAGTGMADAGRADAGRAGTGRAGTGPANTGPANTGRVDAGQRELIDALVRSSFAVMAVLNRIGAEHDLSLTQLRMLGILRDRRITMSELGGYLGLDKSTISGLVSRAEKR